MIVPDQVLQSILNDIDEGKRLKSLSNEELVREYLELGERDDDLHIQAMLDRLWPGWTEVEL